MPCVETDLCLFFCLGCDRHARLLLYPAAKPVKGFQELRTVTWGEGGIVALALTRFTQMRAKVTHGGGHADIGLIENAASRTRDHGAIRHAATGQRNIRGDDDIAFAGTLRNPIVSRVETVRDDDVFHLGIAGGSQP